MFLLVWGVAQFVGVDRFNEFYGNILIFLAYVFTPWTAINLVDYSWVRRGRYAIREIFNPRGIYGRWGWRGTVAYLVGMLVMAPFMVPTPYTGFLAARPDDVDYSMFIGLPVAGLLYLYFCRGLDLEAERRIVDEEGILTDDHHS
jgi:purine-cytosine permease-like protein